VITTNLRLSERAMVFDEAKTTGSLLNRLTHCCHFLEKYSVPKPAQTFSGSL
jgi:hypothetical protein